MSKKNININVFINRKHAEIKLLFIFLIYKVIEIDSIIKNTQLELSNVKKKGFGKNLNSVQLNKKIKKKERDPRHFAPANKEWNNSMFAYYKNSLLDLANKDKLASVYIRSYFNLVPIPLVISKSKRMRDLIRRSSTKQLFLSKPEIKQTNDVATVSVYTFDRHKTFFYRKLFFLRKWLNESFLGKNLKIKKTKKKNINLINKLTKSKTIIKKILMHKKHIIYNKIFSFRGKWNILKRKLPKYYVKNDLYIKNVNILLKKRKYIINLFIYIFMKRILSFFFNKKIFFSEKKHNLIHKDGKTFSGKYINLSIINKKKDRVITEKGKVRYIKCKNLKLIKINRHLDLKTLRSMNILLLKFILSSKQNRHIKNYGLVFNKLKTKYKEALKDKYFRKEILIIKYLSNLYLNKFKYYSYLPGIKSILSNIYNKKIKFNLVKLKNIHLNSDIFSEAISIKLRKRTTSLLRVLRKSFNFVKLIESNKKYISLQKLKNFPTKEVKTYFGKYNVINGNVVNKLFNEMYNYKYLTSIKGILNSVKYKWVSGVRIEAKGRLTKRYAASRALFKYKYRGTLKNLENLRNQENYLQSPGVFMLRGDNKPNKQYSLIHSKRRIGAFGIKGWISNS